MFQMTDEQKLAWVHDRLAGREPPPLPQAAPAPPRRPHDPAAENAAAVAFVHERLERARVEGDPLWAGTPWGPPESEVPEAAAQGSEAEPGELTPEQQAAWVLLDEATQQAALKGDPDAHNLWSALTGALEQGLTPEQAVETVMAEAARAGVELATSDDEEDEPEPE